MNNSSLRLLSTAMLIALLSACSGDDGTDGLDGAQGLQGEMGVQGDAGPQGPEGPTGGFGAYNVTVTNLTHGQPMAPSAVIVHEPGYNIFVSGESASLGLEDLAEGGSPALLISEAQDAVQFLDAQNTVGINPPRATTDFVTVLVPELDIDNVRLSVATMLVDTNDAFGGFSSHDISNMEVGESMTIIAPAWDAGTEANTETAVTMPGPAAQAAGGGGEAAGTSAMRDDIVDAVRIHAGVVTNANASDLSMEGLASSVLDQSDRFDNPAIRVVVTRTR